MSEFYLWQFRSRPSFSFSLTRSHISDSNSPKQMKLCERTKSCSMQSTVFPMLPKPPDVTSGIHPSAFINPFIGCFSPSTFWNYPFWNAVSPFCSVVSPFSSSGAVPFAYLTPTRISNAATIQEIWACLHRTVCPHWIYLYKFCIVRTLLRRYSIAGMFSISVYCFQHLMRKALVTTNMNFIMRLWQCEWCLVSSSAN